MTRAPMVFILIAVISCLMLEIINGQSVSMLIAIKSFKSAYWCHGILDTVTGNVTDVWPANPPYNNDSTYSFSPLPRVETKQLSFLPWAAYIDNHGSGNLYVNQSLTVVDSETKSIRTVSDFIVSEDLYYYSFYDSSRDSLLAVQIDTPLSERIIYVNILSDPFSTKNRSVLFQISVPRPAITVLTTQFTYNDFDQLLYILLQPGPNYFITFSLVDGTIVNNITYPVDKDGWSVSSLNVAWSSSRSQLYHLVNFGESSKSPVPELRVVDPATGVYKILLSGSSLPTDALMGSDEFDDSTGNWLIARAAQPSWLLVNVDTGSLINNGTITTIDGLTAWRIRSPSLLREDADAASVQQF